MISRLVIIMIKVNSLKTVTVEIEGIDYRIDDDDSYRALLIYLTNPNPDVRFDDELFAIDPSIQDAELFEIASRYSDFFKAYSKRRNSRLDSESTAILQGISASEKAVTLLNSEIEDEGEKGKK